MKYIKKINIIVLISAILGLLSCDKEIPYGHPTCDTCDWDVMTCKVDGVFWQARKKCELLSNCDPVDCQYYYQSSGLEIYGSNENSSESIALRSRCNLQNYTCDFINNLSILYASRFKGTCSSFILDTTSNSQIMITRLDTTERLIEGNFNVQLVNNCGDNVRLTEGYFKLTYRY